MKKRILLCLLAALLCTGMVSCGTGTDETTAAETEPVAETMETEPAETGRGAIPDELPEKDFGGQAFRVLTTEGGAIYGFTYSSEIISEELTGDACNDAVHNRNVDIESRFNVSITCDSKEYPSQYISTLVTSGSDEYDVLGMYDFLAYEALNAKAALNWLDVPYVNLEKPWHNQLANNGATINNRLYAICSDLAITSMLYTHAFFFNTTLLADYGYTADDMYTLVKDGKWTLDKAIEITTPMYEDTDGNGKRDDGDTYGFAYSIWNAADVWMAAFDATICTVGDKGIEMSFMNEKTIAIVEKLCDWHYNSGCFHEYPNIYEEETRMRDGTLVMAPIRFKAAFDALRTMEDPYAIIPYPKWDENQAEYLTNADDKFTVFTIPLTAVNNLEFIGIVYEALAAESYKTVYPVYYDTALKGKYSSDPTTAEMVDLVMAGRNFDFSFQFGADCFQRVPYFVRECLQKNDVNITSKYAKIESALADSIQNKLYPVYGIE